MKKITILIVLTVFAVITLVFAAEDTNQGPRTIQKKMQARSNLVSWLERNLTDKRLQEVSAAKNANKLAMETKKTGENLTDPEAKEITLAISSLAEEIYIAATKTHDQRILRGNLDKIKAKCAECHAKFRK